jgi:hypothetical protein
MDVVRNEVGDWLAGTRSNGLGVRLWGRSMPRGGPRRRPGGAVVGEVDRVWTSTAEGERQRLVWRRWIQGHKAVQSALKPGLGGGWPVARIKRWTVDDGQPEYSRSIKLFASPIFAETLTSKIKSMTQTGATRSAADWAVRAGSAGDGGTVSQVDGGEMGNRCNRLRALEGGGQRGKR